MKRKTYPNPNWHVDLNSDTATELRQNGFDNKAIMMMTYKEAWDIIDDILLAELPQIETPEKKPFMIYCSLCGKRFVPRINVPFDNCNVCGDCFSKEWRAMNGQDN